MAKSAHKKIAPYIAASIGLTVSFLYGAGYLKLLARHPAPLPSAATLYGAWLLFTIGASVWLIVRPASTKAAVFSGIGLAGLLVQLMATVLNSFESLDSNLVVTVVTPLVLIALLDIIGLAAAMASYKSASSR
jgi:hypothetical protein